MLKRPATVVINSAMYLPTISSPDRTEDAKLDRASLKHQGS